MDNLPRIALFLAVTSICAVSPTALQAQNSQTVCRQEYNEVVCDTTSDNDQYNGIDYGAFQRGARQAQNDYYRDQQMQQQTLQRDLFIQQKIQMHQQNQMFQYENWANTYLSRIPLDRQEALLKGMNECEFWSRQGDAIAADQNLKNVPVQLNNLVFSKFEQMVFQATGGKGCQYQKAGQASTQQQYDQNYLDDLLATTSSDYQKYMAQKGAEPSVFWKSRFYLAVFSMKQIGLPNERQKQIKKQLMNQCIQLSGKPECIAVILELEQAHSNQ